MKEPDEKNVSKDRASLQLFFLLALGLLCAWPVQAGPAPLDFDGDGKTDFVVVRNLNGSSDPNGAMRWIIVSEGPLVNPRPTLQRPVVSEGQIQLIFNTQAGTNYVIQNKTLLTQLNWQTLTNVTGTGGLVTNKVVIGTNQARYFRVMVP